MWSGFLMFGEATHIKHDPKAECEYGLFELGIILVVFLVVNSCILLVTVRPFKIVKFSFSI